MAVGEAAMAAEALVSRFQFQKLLNQGKLSLDSGFENSAE
jgi:hypothetical protein